ncbi:hypothetical protein FB45DRAFT_1111832 [Roridomyces roridus]|uniref:Uncharacterized protein n=1 Tax=Roridomyces roridus TaxID=1738132 RepID=A0AAD7B7V5_9AGAR|nr:hypothetical protein FB45DRAFT_1111832 [Roridomyces roridus]
MPMNPFTQGCWPTSTKNNSISGSGPGTVPQPSLLGALSFPSPVIASLEAQTSLTSFRFTSFNPTILNLTFLRQSDLRPYFRVWTDHRPAKEGSTVVNDEDKKPTIIVEWAPEDGGGPIVEVRDVVSKRRTGEWLILSEDKSYRTMRALGKTFIWTPQGENLCLYAPGLCTPELFARVSRTEDSVYLDLTAEAVRMGLLPVCVAATLLLQCGRKID